MFVPKPSSIPQSRHSRRDAAVDRQSMELPITLPADHPLQLGNFTSAHLGTFESALTEDQSKGGAGGFDDLIERFKYSQTKIDLAQTFAISMGASIVRYPQETAAVTYAFTAPFERRKAVANRVAHGPRPP